ncbi:unnamed protein product [Gongylonema pulchrum]|uniref:Uncharacterized protein n=1 Tax=Gongylonema pulchrum TaxID=637853 RepID=A0A183D7M0_9BILA|nr:unnamed protein product [Gongylonema pulchrum]
MASTKTRRIGNKKNSFIRYKKNETELDSKNFHPSTTNASLRGMYVIAEMENESMITEKKWAMHSVC